MSERDGYEPGVPCWVDTWQPDPHAAVAFYGEIFEWETEELGLPDSRERYYLCRVRGRDVAGIGTHPGGTPPSAPAWRTYIWVDSAEEAMAMISAAGGHVVLEPFDGLDGGRMAVVSDPAGAVFGLWQPRRHIGARLVNEPRAWSMSQLTTSDPHGAKSFYGAVFGWDTEAFEVAGAEMTMWKVPGYIGGEPQQPVARDVIATMTVPNDQRAEVQSHWSVDFWTRSLDDTVSKATALGATLIDGPHDISDVGMRQATITDPQGATFSLTQPPGIT